ncbi:aldose epimerase family protein [Aestuariibius sp. 2305UL40-4]|uniref:aldose epimerase family protein n=1 Tax=Aestuariibius violaceus TaxID=3234132 RepID=UPI00345ECD9D
MIEVGQTPDGEAIYQVVLSGGALTAKVLSWGAILQDVRLEGVSHALTVGTRTVEPYLTRMASFGGLVGPVVNRISGARAVIDGAEYRFEANHEGRNTLHSASAGTHRKLWTVADHDEGLVRLEITLPDGEGGFPGNRSVSVTYAVDDAALTLTVEAETDAPTLLNFANHSYWTLDGAETVADHRLQIAAERYHLHDATGLPTGEIADVDGTRYDFREERRLNLEKPYDNNMILADAQRPLTRVAELTAGTGVRMVLETTEPGLQLYDAYKMTDLGVPDHEGRPLGPHRGVALEAQGWPDAPSYPDWPQIIARPGEMYRQVTRWTFSKD